MSEIIGANSAIAVAIPMSNSAQIVSRIAHLRRRRALACASAGSADGEGLRVALADHAAMRTV